MTEDFLQLATYLTDDYWLSCSRGPIVVYQLGNGNIGREARSRWPTCSL